MKTRVAQWYCVGLQPKGDGFSSFWEVFKIAQDTELSFYLPWNRLVGELPLAFGVPSECHKPLKPIKPLAPKALL